MEFITYFIQKHSFLKNRYFLNPYAQDIVFRILNFWLNINNNF